MGLFSIDNIPPNELVAAMQQALIKIKQPVDELSLVTALAELTEIRNVLATDENHDEKKIATDMLEKLAIHFIESTAAQEITERLRDRLRDFGVKRPPLTAIELENYHAHYSTIFATLPPQHSTENTFHLAPSLEKILLNVVKKTSAKAFENSAELILKTIHNRELTLHNITDLNLLTESYIDFIKSISFTDISQENLYYHLQKQQYHCAEKLIKHVTLGNFITDTSYRTFLLPWLVHFANEIVQDLFQGKKDAVALQILENGIKTLTDVIEILSTTHQIDLTTPINFPYNPNPNHAYPDETVGIKENDQQTYKNNIQKFNYFPATEKISNLMGLLRFVTQYQHDVFANFLTNEGRKFITSFMHCETNPALKKAYREYKQFRQYWSAFLIEKKMDITFPTQVDPQQKANAIFADEQKMPTQGMFLFIETIYFEQKAQLANFVLGKFFIENRDYMALLNAAATTSALSDPVEAPPSLATPSL